jgi:hypothetical protein
MATSDFKSDMHVITDEKANFQHLEKYLKAGLSHEDAEYLNSISEKEQRRIFHKVDWRLCPMLMILYLISHLDR